LEQQMLLEVQPELQPLLAVLAQPAPLQLPEPELPE
jgi:hypothetical protein